MRKAVRWVAAVTAAAFTFTAAGRSPYELAPVAYDLDIAFNLAGDEVPMYVDSYYFFVLDQDVPVEDEARELSEALRRAAGEHEFLGITGPDPERNLQTLRQALDEVGPERLEGLVLIFVGPLDQQPRLRAPVDATGAELRFVIYPALPPPI